MTITSSVSPTSRLLGNDLLGSAIQKLSASGLRRISYTPFGHAANLQSGSVGFTGQVKEPGTAQYMLGNGYRGYSPTLLRFTAADDLSPFGKGGLNSYSYCLAQPVTRNDPTGHFSWLVALGIPAALAGVGGLVGGAILHEQSPSDLSLGLMIGGAVLAAIGVGAIGVGALRNTASRAPQVRRLPNGPRTHSFRQHLANNPQPRRNWSSPSGPDNSRSTHELHEFQSQRRGGHKTY